MNAPCKGCPKREIGCHSKCEAYRAYREPIDAMNKARHLQKPIKELAIDHTIRSQKAKKRLKN